MKTNKFRNISFFIILCFLSFFNLLNAQEERKIIISKISVNGDTISQEKLTNLVLATKDNLKVNYYLKSGDGDKTAFLFRIIIKQDTMESSTTTSVNSFSYNSLPEGKYRIRITAFDPRNQWTAEPAEINFVVNDYTSSLLKELEQTKANLSKTSTDSSTNKDSLNFLNSSIFGIDILSIIIGFIIGSLIFGIIFIVNKTSLNKKMKEQVMGDEENIKKEKLHQNKLAVENSNLRAEIAALRGQIDAMQSRGEELKGQNNDLKETVDRLRKSQFEFEELQTQKDDLFAVIIHDIKNPAALIKSLVELLRSYDLTATEQQEIIDDIFETTTKIVNLSQEVTRILALESSTIHLKKEMCQLNDVISDVQRHNTIASSNKQIEVLLDLEQDLPEANIDPQKIDEVLDNLLSNSIKFSHKGSQVRIKSYSDESSITVEVSDNGLGMSEDDIRQAFQRGTRLSAKPTAGESTSGFGLWVVKKLVEAHDGKVWVRSVIGKGSTFFFNIPLSSKA